MARSYTLKRSMRSRTMRLSISPDARVIVTAPEYLDLEAIERFVAQQSAWIETHTQRARKRSVIRVRRGDIPSLKKRALALVEERCAHVAQMYGLQFRKISIRAQKTRWGSCSRSGNLSFNYKIAILPPPVAEYIIVHELCHLAEMNHGKKFWDLVARTIPEHRAIRKALRNTAVVFS